MALRPQRLLPLAAALCAAGGAHAQSTPYYVGVSQTLSHESNIYKRQSNEVSDTISSTAFFGGVDQTIGRQRVYGNATVSANKFADNGSLNNTGYGVRAGWDWATIERLSGTVDVSSNQSLARYDTGIDTTEKNELRDMQLRAIARIGVVTRLTAETGYTYRQVDYSLDSYSARNFHQHALSGGFKYRFSGALTAGAALRYTKGTYPDRTPTDDFDRRDIDFTGTWTPTGNSTISGRISLSDSNHSLGTGADFSGVTGDINWDWRPTGKLRFVTTLARDTGEEVNLLNGTTDQVLVNSRVSSSIGTRATYEVSSKVLADAGVRFVHRTLNESRGDGTDNTRILNVGLRWLPTRTISVGCSLSYEKRTASSSVSQDYDANIASCFGQLSLQL